MLDLAMAATVVTKRKTSAKRTRTVCGLIPAAPRSDRQMQGNRAQQLPRFMLVDANQPDKRRSLVLAIWMALF